MELEVKKYWKYKNDLKFMITTTGIWPNFDLPFAFRKILSIFVACTAFTSCFCIINYCLKFPNINVVTSSLGLLIGFITQFVKIIIFTMHQEDLISLNNGIATIFESDLEIPEFRPHLLAHLSMFSKCFYVFTYVISTCTMIIAITPLSLVRHGKYVRMYPQVMPFSYEPGGALHWIIYGYEIISGTHLLIVTCSFDALFGLYALHMVGELRLLGFHFQKLKSNLNYKKELKEYVNKHVLLMESRYKLQRIFSFMAIWLAVTCAIALCTLVFQVVQLKNKSILKLLYYFTHCMLKLTQAYSYAWYGNIIAIESEECLDAMYEAHWPGCGDTQFMNDVLIVISQQPLIFKAKNWFPLRLEMFSKIVNTTISYFFLLKTLDDDSN